MPQGHHPTMARLYYKYWGKWRHRKKFERTQDKVTKEESIIHIDAPPVMNTTRLPIGWAKTIGKRLGQTIATNIYDRQSYAQSYYGAWRHVHFSTYFLTASRDVHVVLEHECSKDHSKARPRLGGALQWNNMMEQTIIAMSRKTNTCMVARAERTA
jgi:hypothetical protein